MVSVYLYLLIYALDCITNLCGGVALHRISVTRQITHTRLHILTCAHTHSHTFPLIKTIL